MKMPIDQRLLHLARTRVTFRMLQQGRPLGRGKNREESELFGSVWFSLQDPSQKWPVDTGSPPQAPPPSRPRPVPPLLLDPPSSWTRLLRPAPAENEEEARVTLQTPRLERCEEGGERRSPPTRPPSPPRPRPAPARPAAGPAALACAGPRPLAPERRLGAPLLWPGGGAGARRHAYA